MSYQSKKKKKGLVNRIKYRFGSVNIALLKYVKKAGRRNGMRYRETSAVMTRLREKTKRIRKNNLRVNEWVDEYVNGRLLEGKPVELLTQMCISKDLEVRYEKQDGFVPTRKERMLFEKEMPEIANIFRKNGMAIEWWLTFNQSYLDAGRISDTLRHAYAAMIAKLAEPLVCEGWLMLADWEEDVLMKRSEPSKEVLASINRFVKPEAMELEVQRHAAWSRDDADMKQSDEELYRDVCFKIACEAEEGRYLANGSSFGECLLVPLESPERYDFFTLLTPDLKKRVVAVLPPYPWRLKEVN